MAYWIEVKTVSELAPGSGDSDAGAVDRDIVHDALGLPYLPARRVKGALREAAEAVCAALGPAAARVSLCAIDDLFGRSGAPDSGWLQMENLRLPDADATGEWLAWATARPGSSLTPERVLASWSSVRTQTRIEPQSGTAAENTLRRTRVLLTALTFAGSVGIAAPISDAAAAARRMLALACAASRRLGLSRNRGLGRVCVRLYSDSAHSADLTKEALDELAALAKGRSN